MTDVTKLFQASLEKRHNAEKRFRFYGLLSGSLAVIFVLVLIQNIVSQIL